jgi:hypothetical protein
LDLQPKKPSLNTLSFTIVDNYFSVGLARSLLQNSAANEAEAFAITTFIHTRHAPKTIVISIRRKVYAPRFHRFLLTLAVAVFITRQSTQSILVTSVNLQAKV